MTTTPSGSVEAGRDINARDIITGLKIDNLTVVMTGLDELSRRLEQPAGQFQRRPDGGLEIVAGPESPLLLPPDLLEAFKHLPRATSGLTPSERHRAYAAWLVTRQSVTPHQRVAARQHYVPLAGHTSWDWQDDLLQPRLSWLRPVGDGPEQRLEREQLADVTEAVQRFPAFVLLGPPGSGKSTVLERLVYTTACNYLAGRERRLPLWVTLANYHWPRRLPLDFIRAGWQAQVAADFVDLARSGQILLLLDGLNEMPRLAHNEDRGQRAGAWQHLLDDYFAEDSPTGSRAIIASRDADDYEQRLGLPRVELDSLDKAQIKRFAGAYLAAETENFLADLERLKLERQAANPFALYILTQLHHPAGRGLPANRGLMFARYASGLLSVMYPRQETELQAALAALAHLGYALQETGEGTVLTSAEICGHLPARVNLPRRRRPVEVDPPEIFERTVRAGLLSQVDEAGDTYKFSHQLLQEQFAARHLLTRQQSGPDLAGLWHTPRRPAHMPAPQVGEWDPLPPPPPTGWEQSTILAAGMLPAADEFVRAVLAVNPALAGRCINEGAAPITPDTLAAVQQALLQDLGNPALPRRARLQAGQVLGQVGDPRFEPVTLNGVEIILPDLLEVPGGPATLGNNEAGAFADEQPVHQVEVAPFYLARTPVTNAEYACFIRAGGYDNESYWTPTGWQWRQGTLEESGPVEQLMDIYRNLVQNPNLLEDLLREERMLPDEADKWRNFTKLSEPEARQQALRQYPLQSHEQPHYWDDPAYNAPNQPVVGVTWFEAMAYCTWLNEQVTKGEWTNLPMMNEQLKPEALAIWTDIQSKIVNRKSKIRLPTEAEWEWAAGGPDHQRYPWGDDFDSDKANTLEGRVLGTSPVGAYPAGAAVCGALDLSGNVFEWTHTIYEAYPYRANDGREEVERTNVRRALRGGGWSNCGRFARVSSRNLNLPDYFSTNYSFRLVVAPVIL